MIDVTLNQMLNKNDFFFIQHIYSRESFAFTFSWGLDDKFRVTVCWYADLFVSDRLGKHFSVDHGLSFFFLSLYILHTSELGSL